MIKLELPDCVAQTLLRELVDLDEQEKEQDETRDCHLTIVIQMITLYWQQKNGMTKRTIKEINFDASIPKQ